MVDAPVDRLQRVVHVQRLQRGALELALVQAGVEFQLAQRVEKTVGLGHQWRCANHLRVGLDHAGPRCGFGGQGMAGG